jgi:molybdate transport system permease protein
VRRAGWWAASAPLLLFLAIPIVALLVSARPAEVLEGLRANEARAAIALSAWTSLLSTAVIFVLGTPLAYVLARRPRGFGRVVEALVDFPLLLPPAVAGVALLMAFGSAGLAGGALEAAGVRLPFTSAAVILAQVFVACPLYVRAASIGIRGIGPELAEAAEIDGSSTWDTFRRIQFPLAAFAIAEGLIVSWARALGEFGATLIFAGNYPGTTQTMPIAIYLGFEFDFAVALALSALLLGTSLLVLLLARWVRPVPVL